MRLTTLAIIILCTACLEKMPLSGGTGSRSSSDEKNGEATPQNTTDGQKDTDQSEGIPGYLVDPARLQASLKNEANQSLLDVLGPDGAVKEGSELYTNLIVRFFQPTSKEDIGAGVVRLTGTPLGRVTVSATGAFTAQGLAVDPQKLVILTVDRTSLASDFETLILTDDAKLTSAMIALPDSETAPKALDFSAVTAKLP